MLVSASCTCALKSSEYAEIATPHSLSCPSYAAIMALYDSMSVCAFATNRLTSASYTAACIWFVS
ncbi:hypothetical protein MBAV_000135 [Candidatus Magnetobacterium bavaricum]|uniref:Uncharacterized protein n=1 Tax=Candidatus Magnetobacterium bavaricum TaxID=29290 RepID=A0A0F3H0K9_9BACT|nr:hypothetical protein MBAV_000135 [Candidatus Magnetobacterium bavaricum]